MHFRRHILLTAVAAIPAFLAGCGAVATYYPKASAPSPVAGRVYRIQQLPSLVPDKPQATTAEKRDPKVTEHRLEQKPVEQKPQVPIPMEFRMVRFRSQSAQEQPPLETPEPDTDNSNATILPAQFEPAPAEEPPPPAAERPPYDPVPLPESDGDVKPLPTAGVTLEQLESLAMQHNPSIKQASAAANKASGLRTQVGLKPNPRIQYFAEEMGSESSGGLQGAAVSQTFVTGGKLQANRRVIDQDYQSVLWEAEAQRYRVRTDVRSKFYQALAAQQRMQLARDFYEVAEKGRQVARDRLQALEGARPDLLQTEIQLSEVEIIQRKAEVEYRAAWNALATVVGLPDMTPAELHGELPLIVAERDLEVLYQQLLSTSPELQAAFARVNAARANLKRQDIQAIPNLTGQVGVGQDNANGNGFANVQLSIPLPIHNRNQGNVQAAYADYCRATQDVARLKLAIRSRLVETLQNYNQARVTVDQYAHAILPKAKENMELTEQAYLADQFDFLRVLVARLTYFETNLAFLQARAELAAAEAQIDGLLLSGGLDAPAGYDRDDALRSQVFSQQ